jgi:hypothetical protein
MESVIRFLDIFMSVLLVPIGFLILFTAQLKILSMLRTQQSLLFYYGKQIEEIRKIVAGGGGKRPDISPDDTGLYDVLSEDDQ